MPTYRCWRTADETVECAFDVEAGTAELAAIQFIRTETDSDSESYDVSVLDEEGRLVEFYVDVHHDIRYTTRLARKRGV